MTDGQNSRLYMANNKQQRLQPNEHKKSNRLNTDLWMARIILLETDSNFHRSKKRPSTIGQVRAATTLTKFTYVVSISWSDESHEKMAKNWQESLKTIFWYRSVRSREYKNNSLHADLTTWKNEKWLLVQRRPILHRKQSAQKYLQNFGEWIKYCNNILIGWEPRADG